ncbi:MAG: NADH-quinone oxidoreductase subunit J [Cytophagales bacterium]|nr:MAG: NADH-quinone oxidoreductase subunit J [Cytophagales bacterium]
MITMLSISGIFILAGADFLAIAQIMIYIGGILILILFGIMLTQRNNINQVPISNFRTSITSILIIGLVFTMLITIIFKLDSESLINQRQELIASSSISQIGFLLMTQNLIAFELIGILLMVALMGAAMIAAQFQDKPIHANSSHE